MSEDVYPLTTHDQYWFFNLLTGMPVFDQPSTKILVLQGYIKYSEGLIQLQLCPVFQVCTSTKGGQQNEGLCIDQPFLCRSYNRSLACEV